MNKEAIKDLNDLRKELGISREDFVNLLTKVLIFQKTNNKHLPDEQLSLLIENILLNYDGFEIEYDGYKLLRKSLGETIKKGITCFDNKN